MKMKIIISVLLIGLLAGAWALYDYRQKWKSGYCFKEDRYLNQDEIYTAALEGLNTSLNASYNNFWPTQKPNVYHYTGVQDIRDRNPNCCEKSLGSSLLKKNGRTHNYIKEHGSFLYQVTVNLKLDKNLVGSTESSVFIQLNACGIYRSQSIYGSENYPTIGVYSRMESKLHYE